MKKAFIIPFVCLFFLVAFSVYLIDLVGRKVSTSFLNYQSYVLNNQTISFLLDNEEFILSSSSQNRLPEDKPLFIICLPQHRCRPCEISLLEKVSTIFPDYQRNPQVIVFYEDPISSKIENTKESNGLYFLNSVTQDNSLLFVCVHNHILHSFIPSAEYPEDLKHYLQMVKNFLSL